MPSELPAGRRRYLSSPFSVMQRTDPFCTQDCNKCRGL